MREAEHLRKRIDIVDERPANSRDLLCINTDTSPTEATARLLDSANYDRRAVPAGSLRTYCPHARVQLIFESHPAFLSSPPHMLSLVSSTCSRSEAPSDAHPHSSSTLFRLNTRRSV